MRVNQVVVVPAFHAKFKPGRVVGRTSEHDIVAEYTRNLAEQFDEDNVAHDVYSHEHKQLILPNSLVMHCSVGWQGNGKGQKAQKNVTSVMHGPQPGSKKFAELLAEALSDWGKCMVDHGHRTKAVEEDLDLFFLQIPETIAVSIEPFWINGPNATDYTMRLFDLGRVLSQTVFEFLLSRNEQPRIMRHPQKSGEA